MQGKRDWYKHRRGRALEEDTKRNRRTLGQVVDLRLKRSKSGYDIRLLGTGTVPVEVSEEERTHTHIIGTTRVGKSKFIEYMMMEDIKRGHGLCFIDSSDGGSTAYDMLRYLANVGHKKVLFIDPLHTFVFKRIAPLDVFGRYPDESAENVLDLIQIQFQQKDISETPVIKQYLPAIIRVLHKAELAFSDALYFTQPVFVEQREEIFAKVGRTDYDVLMLRNVFRDRELFREYRPTARRILDLLNPMLSLYFGSRRGVKFTELVADKWVVIVNLYPQKGFGESPARFLGTAIINSFISAMDDLTGNPLRENQWKGKYYLYVDEVGRYANRNLADVFSYKAKSGLTLTVAHQNLGQIEDSYVRDTILNQTSTKIVLRLESEDTHRVGRIIYGGQVKDRDAAYYINRLSKQHGIVKLPAQDAVSVRFPDVKIPDADIKAYLDKVYANKWYVPIEEIQTDQKNRVTQPEEEDYHQTEKSSKSQETKLRNDTSRTSTPSSKKRAAPNKKSTGKSTSSKRPDTGWEDLIQSLREDTGANPKDDSQ